MPSIGRISHLALTVSNLDVSAPWYMALLDAQPVMEIDTEGQKGKVLLTAGGFILGLRQHASTGSDDRFDETRVGLDHASFLCANRDEVVSWETRLDELGIEHSPIADTDYGTVLVLRDPDNIQLEFHSLPG